jgi:hypothetical protein
MNRVSPLQKSTTPLFTIEPRRWYAMQLWMDGIFDLSPVRIHNVRPLKNGTNELELEFYHASYPEGVRDKNYRLRILFRGTNYLLAHCIGYDDNRCVWISNLTADWLWPHIDEPLAHAIECEPNLDVCLDRFFNIQTEPP